MNLLVLDMPDTDEGRINWLEQQLVDVRLHQLIEELGFVRSSLSNKADRAYYDARTEWQALPQLDCRTLLTNCLKCDTRQILVDGLRALTPGQLSELLRQPHLLWPLQELVLIHGSDYWQRVCERVATEKSPARRPAQLAISLWAVMALAVSIIAIAFVVRSASQPSIPATSSQWGPAKLAEVTKLDLPEDEYRELLAESVRQWYDKRPLDQPALIRRAQQFVAGCQTLIDLPHPNLTAERSLRLRSQCERCQHELRAQIILLQQQKISFAVALVAMDDSIDRLHANLRA